jgi:hypothetical protein
MSMALDRKLAAALLEMPNRLRTCAGELPQDRWARPPAPGQYSLVEHACHLRDLEEEGYTLRIRRLLREDSPVLPDFDGKAVAAARNYPGQELEAALRAFEEARLRNVALLDALPDALLERRGWFDDGTITLRQLAGLMLEHDASHRTELDELMGTRRNGKPA